MMSCPNIQHQMTNKEASNLQEIMVSKFLGWDIVVGSGARPFRPGDIQNEHYLVECKTHVDEQKKIVFNQSHWQKIQKEARSVGKYPALVTDNGTQDYKYTWVMIPVRSISPDRRNKIIGLDNSSRSGNTVMFTHEIAKSLYKVYYDANLVNYLEEDWDNDKVAILSLEEFRRFYQEEFEC